MITEKDLQEAIAECEGQRNPTANTCIKLAAFYTIKQHMFPGEVRTTLPQLCNSYSRESSQTDDGLVHVDSDSEFAKTIEGLPADIIWNIIDELMETLSVLNPKLYKSTMSKINAAG